MGFSRQEWVDWSGLPSASNAGDTRDPGSIPTLGRFPGEGNGNPLQHSCQENPMDRGAWQAQGSCGPGSLDLTDQLQHPVCGLGFRKGGPASALDGGLPTLGGRRCTSRPGSGCHQLAGSRPRPGSAFGQVTLFDAASRQGQGSRAVHPSPQFPNLQGLVFLWAQGLSTEGIPGCVQDHPCRGPGFTSNHQRLWPVR